MMGLLAQMDDVAKSLGIIPTGILPDWEIRRLARDHQLITPFVDGKVNERGISHGLSPFGYDCRLADEWLVPSPMTDDDVDPTQPNAGVEWLTVHDKWIVLEPGGMILGRTIETFVMPPDVLGEAKGKSTWARCGIDLNTTIIEPGWRGTLTLEISNCSRRRIVLTAGLGICQIVFTRGAMPESAYSGKYNGQTSVTPPRAASCQGNAPRSDEKPSQASADSFCSASFYGQQNRPGGDSAGTP